MADFVLALGLLLLLTPLLLLVAAAVKLSSPGPVLYRQRRLMRGGWTFTLLKFRTMVTGADAMITSAFSDPVTGALFKSKAQKSDPRVTGLGRLLRASFIDELPQLINVLKGEMSFVGPRPCQPYEAEGMPREFTVRFAVPQGLTGPWQIQRNGRPQVFTEQLRVEAAYVDDWSLLGDLRILVKTIPVVIGRCGV